MTGADDLIDPPHTRESGILVSVDEHGRELRLHKDGRGLWMANTWRVWPPPPMRPAKPERWICGVAWGLTAEQWIACGKALRCNQVEVGHDPPD